MTEGSTGLVAASIFLWTAAVPDFKTKRIPVWIPAVFLPVAFSANLMLFSMTDRRELWGGAVPGAMLMLFSFMSGGKVGGGDGICLLICGLFAGITRTILIAEIALLLVAVVGGVLLLTKRRRADDCVPFVPFLAVASTLLLLCGG